MAISPVLPERINRLGELANNLWWSWHPTARSLFRMLDYPMWRLSGHNPARQFREATQERLDAAAGDSAFLSLYDSAISALDHVLTDGDSWWATKHPGALPGPVAYFSMEYAIHNSLPIY